MLPAGKKADFFVRIAMFILYLLLSAPSLARAEVLEEPDSEFLDATEILNRIVAAGDGDVIVIQPGIYIWDNRDSGYEIALDVRDKTNLVIQGQGDVYVFCTGPNDVPIQFSGCDNVTVENIHFGHAVPEDSFCVKGVVYIKNSSGVTLKNCVLHGSGLFGVEAENSADILLESCSIIECTAHMVSLNSVDTFTMRDSLVALNDTRDMGGSLLAINGATNVLFEHTLFAGNKTDFGFIDGTSNVVFAKNIFADNTFQEEPVAEISMDDNTMGRVGSVCSGSYRMLVHLNNKPGPLTDTAADSFHRFMAAYRDVLPVLVEESGLSNME